MKCYKTHLVEENNRNNDNSQRIRNQSYNVLEGGKDESEWRVERTRVRAPWTTHFRGSIVRIFYFARCRLSALYSCCFANLSMKRRSFSVTPLFFLAIVSLPCGGLRRGCIFYLSVGDSGLFFLPGQVHLKLSFALRAFWMLTRLSVQSRHNIVVHFSFFCSDKARLASICYGLFARNHSTGMFVYPSVINPFLGRVNKFCAVHTF